MARWIFLDEPPFSESECSEGTVSSVRSLPWRERFPRTSKGLSSVLLRRCERGENELRRLASSDRGMLSSAKSAIDGKASPLANGGAPAIDVLLASGMRCVEPGAMVEAKTGCVACRGCCEEVSDHGAGAGPKPKFCMAVAVTLWDRFRPRSNGALGAKRSTPRSTDAR